jgi:hypothetical protein
MRVLVLSQYFHPENSRINEVVLNLVDKGFEVEVLTGKPNYPEGLFSPVAGDGATKRKNC